MAALDRRCTRLEVLALALAAPLLMFPTLRPAWTAAALAALAGVWLLRWAALREPWPVTPMNGALLVFAAMIPIAVWTSAFPELTLPKLTGLILGLAAFRAFALFTDRARALPWALAALAVIGLGILVGGLLGTRWPTKFALMEPLVERVSRLAVGGEGINPNQLAGAMALLLPLAASCALSGLRMRRPAMALAGLLLFGLTGGVLILTQSRGGWLGGLTGLAVLAALWALAGRRHSRHLAGVLIAAAILALLATAGLYLGSSHVSQIAPGLLHATGPTELGAQVTLSQRLEIWSRAAYAIQDFPFTGVGLGAFRRVVGLLYPLFLMAPESDIAHAHNIFLQTALDLGLPGLIAYLALLELAAVTAWGVGRQGSQILRAAAFGLLAGLVALHVYGITDALALGSKPGLAFWAILGLIAALPKLQDAEKAY